MNLMLALYLFLTKLHSLKNTKPQASLKVIITTIISSYHIKEE